MINFKSLSGQETFTDLSKLPTNSLYPITSCCFNLSLKIPVTTHIYNYSVLIFFLSQLTLKYLLTLIFITDCIVVFTQPSFFQRNKTLVYFFALISFVQSFLTILFLKFILTLFTLETDYASLNQLSLAYFTLNT